MYPAKYSSLSGIKRSPTLAVLAEIITATQLLLQFHISKFQTCAVFPKTNTNTKIKTSVLKIAPKIFSYVKENAVMHKNTAETECTFTDTHCCILTVTERMLALSAAAHHVVFIVTLMHYLPINMTRKHLRDTVENQLVRVRQQT